MPGSSASTRSQGGGGDRGDGHDAVPGPAQRGGQRRADPAGSHHADAELGGVRGLTMAHLVPALAGYRTETISIPTGRGGQRRGYMPVGLIVVVGVAVVRATARQHRSRYSAAAVSAAAAITVPPAA